MKKRVRNRSSIVVGNNRVVVKDTDGVKNKKEYSFNLYFAHKNGHVIQPFTLIDKDGKVISPKDMRNDTFVNAFHVDSKGDYLGVDTTKQPSSIRACTFFGGVFEVDVESRTAKLIKHVK